MDNFYNLGSGLTAIEATSVDTQTLTCDDFNTQSGIANFNLSSLSNIQNAYIKNNFVSSNITACNVSTSNALIVNITSSNLTTSNVSASNLNITNGLINLATNNSTYINFTETGFGDRFGLLAEFSGGGDANRFSLTSSAFGSNPKIADAKLTLLQGGNIGIGTTTPAYKLDINGTSIIRNGNNSTGWTNNQILFGFGSGTSYRHAINTRHNAGGGVNNSIDFLVWNNNVALTDTGTTNAMSLTPIGVGVMTSNPANALDVVGTISASSNVISNRNIFGSNLNTSNLIIYRGSNVLDTDAKIDYNKWIKNGPIMTDGSGVIIIPLPVIINIYNNINPSINTDTGGDGDENYDPSTNPSNIFVHWRNVIHHPFYCRTGTDEQVAFGSNVFIEKNSKIYGVDSVDLIKTDAGRIRTLDSSLLNPIVFYDFGNQECFLKVLNSSSNINASNIITSNILSSNITSCNFTTVFATASNVSSSNIYASNLDTRVFTAINANTSNLLSSNIVNVNLWTSNITSSNITGCNYYGRNAFLSNISSCNVFNSNLTACNVSTNLLQATSINSQTSIIDTMTARIVGTSNITSCNIKTLTDDFYSFSNQSWKFNGSNIWHGSNEFVIGIGKSNATEKLDILGNLKVSGGGSFANNNFVISSNTSAVHSLTINTCNIFRTDGNIGNHLLSNLNTLTGNQTFTGTAGDIYDPKAQSSNLYANWNAVIWKPLYQDNLFNVGFSSNVFFNRFSQLCTTEASWDYTKTSNGMFKTFNAPFVRSNVVIDFNTYTATLCNVITSNATINFNLTTSNINTSNLSTSNINTSNIYARNANLSNVWASNVGINQVNPLYNLDVNGGARIQDNLIASKDIICTSNITASNIVGNTEMSTSNLWARSKSILYQYMAGATNRAIPLEVINTYTAGTYGICQMSLKVSNSNGYNIGFDQCSAHGSIQAGFDASGIYMSMGVSNWYGSCPNSLTIRNGGNVGIGTSNPAYTLDVNGTFAIRNGNIFNGWSANQILFGYSGTNTYQHAIKTRHQATGGNTNSIDFMLWNNNVSSTTIGTVNAMSISATGVGVMMSNPTTALEVAGTIKSTGAQITSTNVLEFGQGTTKESSAGKVGYETFTSGALDIVGAGTTGNPRGVKIWDNLTVNNNLTVGGSIQFGGGTTLLTQKIVNYSIGMGIDGLNQYTITHNLSTSSYNVFFSHEDTASPVVDDTFLIKVLSKGTNTVNIGIMRRTGAFWNRSWNLVCMFIVS